MVRLIRTANSKLKLFFVKVPGIESRAQLLINFLKKLIFLSVDVMKPSNLFCMMSIGGGMRIAYLGEL